MNTIFRKYRNLIGLLLVIMLAVALYNLGMAAATCIALVACWQLVQFARSRNPGYCCSCTLTAEQIGEFEELLLDLKGNFALFKQMPGRLKALEKDNDELRGQVNRLRKGSLGGQTGVRWLGNVPFVTDDCASALTSVFILQCAQLPNGLESLIQDGGARERIKAHAAATLGIAMRAAEALTGDQIPLPTVYVPQIIELVFKYGQARQYATVFPLGAGTVKLPRLKAGEDNFTYLGAGTGGMSQEVQQKQVTAELVTFTANKMGGLIRIPYEIEIDTFVPIGQFLARYIARQFAKLEDTTLFLADGTATYANQTGIGPYCDDGGALTYTLQLAGGKTKPSDATLADFRNLRSKVSPAILAGGFEPAYYMSPTFEPFLRSFNAYPNFVIFENVNGQPKFDGWPVRWVGVTQSYVTQAAANTYIAFFGALNYWYLGERGAPRVEVSREVFFATDELAMRALERIDVEAMGIDAMAALKTAGA